MRSFWTRPPLTSSMIFKSAFHYLQNICSTWLYLSQLRRMFLGSNNLRCPLFLSVASTGFHLNAFQALQDVVAICGSKIMLFLLLWWCLASRMFSVRSFSLSVVLIFLIQFSWYWWVSFFCSSYERTTLISFFCLTKFCSIQWNYWYE